MRITCIKRADIGVANYWSKLLRVNNVFGADVCVVGVCARVGNVYITWVTDKKKHFDILATIFMVPIRGSLNL